MEPGVMTTGVFARRAGVTVRTLRYYDRLGLLRPAAHGDHGHRLYRPEQLARLQQVSTLKLLGFPLAEIRRVLDAPGYDLARSLEAQRAVLADQARRLETVMQAIDQALGALSRSPVEWDRFAAILQATETNMSNEWVMRYYTSEQQAALAARDYTPEQAQADAARWGEVLEDIKRLMADGADPAGPAAQAAAARCQGLIDEFTQGDPAMAKSLNALYADRANWPQQAAQAPEFAWMSEDLMAYMERMMKARKG